MQQSLMLLVFFAFLSACGDDLPSLPTSMGTEGKNFNLNYNSSFAERVESIQSGLDDSIWIASAKKTNANSEISTHLENRSRKDKYSSIEHQFELKNQQLSNFFLKENGDLVVATFKKIPSDFEELSLNLFIINPHGEILKERAYEDYNFKDSIDVPCKSKYLNKTFMWKKSVSLASFKDQILMMTYHCFYSTLTMLDSNLEILWSRAITIASSELSSFYGDVDLLVSETGTIVAITKISSEDFESFNQFYGTHLKPIGDEDILVLTYDRQGHHLNSAVIGTESFDWYDKAVVDKNSLYLVGSTTNDAHQRDLLVAAVDLSDVSLLWQKTMNIKNEDSAESIAVVDHKYLMIGGTTDFLQARTGSVTKHGDAFLLMTDLKGQVLGQKIFGTSRHDEVSTIFDLGSGTVMVGGYKDGPITHDGDQDRNNLHSFGFIETFLIKNLF